MPLTMKLFSFGLFVVLFFSSSISIVEARESKFFSKFTHLTIFKHKKHSHSIEAPAPSSILFLAPEPSSVHIPIAAPEFAPAPSPIEDEPQNGYGLYGEGDSSQFPTTHTTTDHTLDEKELLGDRLYAENYNTYSQNINKDVDVDVDNDKDVYTNNYNYNYNAYVYDNNYEETTNNNINNGYYTTNNEFTDYKSIEKEGMSDTRLMENDKYYYNPTEYETGKKSYNNGGYYFGSNEKFSDEFNNFTEENYQEEYKP